MFAFLLVTLGVLLVGASGWILWYLLRRDASPPVAEVTASELDAYVAARIEAAKAPLEDRIRELEAREPAARPAAPRRPDVPDADAP